MPINPLDQLNPGSRDWMVQVYVSRLWQHRGASDDGPIKHTDIVFQDVQGNHMYGEIAPNLVNQFIDRLREGRVYELARFLVNPKKNNYRPVEGQFIIRFGRYTTVREIPDALMDYPLCTYALTPIDDLPAPTDLPETFTDVVGIITGVSPISQYHSASRSTPSTKRVVYLSDMSGYQISVVLWGEQARSFDGEGVLRTTQTAPVVVIFVGTLVKHFEGRRALSGGAPCRWYINQDLPEINELLAKLNDKVPAVQTITLPGQSASEISAQVDLETKTVRELLDLNIWNHAKTRFFCTVVIGKLSPGQRWWFSACTTCNKGTLPYGTAYRCPEKNCDGIGAMPRYQVCYLGSDGTGEVELVFFEKAGKELIGKTALALIRSKVPHGIPLEEAIQFARTDQSTPREIAAVVTKKFCLVVSVTNNSFKPESEKPSYQIHRIDMQYGRQPQASAVRHKPGLVLASCSKSADSGLNSLGDALATDAIIGQASSSNAGTGVSDAPISTDLGASAVVSETNLPQTPHSVTKPPIPSDGKDLTDSVIKIALFTDSPPRDGSKDVLESDLLVNPQELPPLPVTTNPDASPTPSATSVTEKTNNRRRPLTQKTTAETQNKRKK